MIAVAVAHRNTHFPISPTAKQLPGESGQNLVACAEGGHQRFAEAWGMWVRQRGK